MTGNKTAYLVVILDENGVRKSVGFYSEPHPTMSFRYTSAIIGEHTAESYGKACDVLTTSLRSVSPYRDWILRELEEAGGQGRRPPR